VIVADSVADKVYELTPGGAQTTLPFGGLNGPTGVAVDVNGDIFVSDTQNARIVVLPAGSSTQEPVLTPVPLSQPEGLATGPLGTLDIADANQHVVQVGGPSPGVLPFATIVTPYGITVDTAGDVFESDQGLGHLTELTPQDDQTTIPVAGIGRLGGVAADRTGDLFVVDTGGTVYELTPVVPSGALAASPTSGPAGTQIGVSSVAPCPVGGAGGTLAVTLTLYTAQGQVVQTVSTGVDAAGDWSGALTVPATATAGATYFAGARCLGPSGAATQYYARAAFRLAECPWLPILRRTSRAASV
jgi:streptogramin lyase